MFRLWIVLIWIADRKWPISICFYVTRSDVVQLQSDLHTNTYCHSVNWYSTFIQTIDKHVSARGTFASSCLVFCARTSLFRRHFELTHFVFDSLSVSCVCVCVCGDCQAILSKWKWKIVGTGMGMHSEWLAFQSELFIEHTHTAQTTSFLRRPQSIFGVQPWFWLCLDMFEAPTICRLLAIIHDIMCMDLSRLRYHMLPIWLSQIR